MKPLRERLQHYLYPFLEEGEVFGDLDSLAKLDFVTYIEEEEDINISISQIEHLSTIDDLVELIEGMK
jgi:acyl carrier protein